MKDAGCMTKNRIEKRRNQLSCNFPRITFNNGASDHYVCERQKSETYSLVIWRQSRVVVKIMGIHGGTRCNRVGRKLTCSNHWRAQERRSPFIHLSATLPLQEHMHATTCVSIYMYCISQKNKKKERTNSSKYAHTVCSELENILPFTP